MLVSALLRICLRSVATLLDSNSLVVFDWAISVEHYNVLIIDDGSDGVWEAQTIDTAIIRTATSHGHPAFCLATWLMVAY